ncbi:peptidoglycan DD-metalloendopeptidase family protein [Clostridium sp. SHJSY1]|uniref:murein hydrolase activator EnvC family protein n=1 Tax=Clostridium sp. SHJSY1 TaxID=2942483 RepID=UPI002874A6D0|nr:peptidoglycan DD-metalloendopeptidase family protein [Clostridium sp. SHJSY1]MDS0525054.1 peptidoglycan DD-metalloendopeptidase family protein [Clostridium sp. SHJSY1]
MMKNVIKVIIMTIMFNTMVISQVVFAANGSSLQSEIENNKRQIDALEKQKNDLNEEKKTANKNLDLILNRINEKNNKLVDANKNIESFQSKIDELKNKINDYENNIKNNNDIIREKVLLIESKENEMEQTENLLGNRLRNYYKNNISTQIIYTILQSDGFVNLISNINTINKLVEMDSKLINVSKEIKQIVEKEKESIQEETDKLNKEKEQIEVLQKEQVQIQKSHIEEKNIYEAQMNELKILEDEKQNILNSLSDEEKEIQEKIGDLNSYNNNLQGQIDNLFNNINNKINVENNISSGEAFLMPANGPISSPYGPRVHPIFGTNGFHTGIDIAAGNNSPIYASKSGKVVFAGVQSGYGNTVIIDHGSGIQTLYAHCNSISVSNGQAVTRGDVIAKVGSTGNSTGPHLHFEVRLNGKHQNPSSYLK